MAELDPLRQAWLNPPDLVVRVAEVVPGYPDRILPVNDAAAEELKKRTLTNLYNQRPARGVGVKRPPRWGRVGRCPGRGPGDAVEPARTELASGSVATKDY